MSDSRPILRARRWITRKEAKELWPDHFDDPKDDRTHVQVFEDQLKVAKEKTGEDLNR